MNMIEAGNDPTADPGSASRAKQRVELIGDPPPPAPGTRGFWLGIVGIAAMAVVGVGGQLFGLLAVDEVAEARIELEATQRETARLLAELPALRAEATAAGANLADVVLNLKQQQRLTQLAEDAANEAAAAQARALTERRDAEVKRDSALKEHETLQTRIVSSATSLATLTAELQSTEEQVDAIQPTLAQLKQQLDSLIDQRDGELEVIDSLQGQAGSLQAFRTNLQADVQKLQTQQAALLNQQAELQAQVSGLRESKRLLEERVAGAEVALASVQNQESVLKSSVDTAKRQRAELEGSNAELSGIVLDLQMQEGKTRSKLEELSKRRDDLESQVSQLEARVSEAAENARAATVLALDSLDPLLKRAGELLGLIARPDAMQSEQGSGPPQKQGERDDGAHD